VEKSELVADHTLAGVVDINCEMPHPELFALRSR